MFDLARITNIKTHEMEILDLNTNLSDLQHISEYQVIHKDIPSKYDESKEDQTTVKTIESVETVESVESVDQSEKIIKENIIVESTTNVSNKPVENIIMNKSDDKKSSCIMI